MGLGRFPGDLAIAPDGKTIYVAQRDGLSIVSAVDDDGRVTRLALSMLGGGVAIAPNGAIVYVAAAPGPMLMLIDVATNTLKHKIWLGYPVLDVGVHPDGSTVYVSLFGSGVAVIDSASHRVRKTISVGGSGGAVKVSPQGRFLYVSVPHGLAVVDTVTEEVRSEIRLGGDVGGVVFHPRSPQAYVMLPFPALLCVVDTASHVLTGTLSVAHIGAAAITPDGDYIYGADREDESILVLSTARVSALSSGGTSPGATPGASSAGAHSIVASGYDDVLVRDDLAFQR